MDDEKAYAALLTPAKSLHEVYEVGHVIGRGGFATVRSGRKLADNSQGATCVLVLPWPANDSGCWACAQIIACHPTVHPPAHPPLYSRAQDLEPTRVCNASKPADRIS